MVSISILSSAVNKVGRLALSSGAVVLALAAVTCPAVGQSALQAPAAVARPAPAAVVAKPAWISLSPAQKLALEPLVGEWDRMEAPRKQKWLEIANRFASMKPDEQARVHDKMREWVKMTPDERRLVRENYTRAKKLDGTQKSEQWEKYQQLPEEQKQKLAAEAAKSKKQLTNLPTAAQAQLKTATPIKKTAPPAASAGVANVPATATVPPATTAATPAAAPVNAK